MRRAPKAAAMHTALTPTTPFSTLAASTLACGLASVACSGSLPEPEFERFDARTAATAADHPDAPAVVLLDRGTLLLTSHPKTKRPLARIRRYRRVKILRETGLGEARVVARHDYLSALHGLKVRAIHPDGRISEPDDSARHMDDAAGGGAWHVAVDAGVGSIIETTYDTYLEDPRFIPPWVFAGPLPTERSEYAVVVPDGFQVDLRYTEKGEFLDRPPERFENEYGIRFFWSRTKLPPIYPEEAMPSPSRIAPAAHVIFLSARVGDQTFSGFSSWEAAGAWFLNRRTDYGELSEAARSEARRVTGDAPRVEKALKLMEVLARDLPAESDEPAPLWRARLPHPERVLKERRANPTSRGLLLVSLLRSAGVPAVPALYSYRDTGARAPDAPTVTLLDGGAAAIVERDRVVILDPSQLTVSADVPSPRLMDTRIVLLRDEVAEVHRVPIAKPEYSRTQVRVDVQLDPRGELFGPVEATLTGAEAGALRTLLFAVHPEAYAETVSTFLRSRGAPLPIESVRLTNLKALRRPLQVEGTIRVPLELNEEGDLVTLRVRDFVGARTEVPREVRRAPLILDAPAVHEVRGTVTLPEEWEPAELTPEKNLRWPSGELKLELRAETRRRIGFHRRVISRDLEVPPSGYRRYRRFVQELGMLEDSTITVKRPPKRPMEF